MEIPSNIYKTLKSKGYSDVEIEAEAKRRGYTMPKGFFAEAWSDVGETLGGFIKSTNKRGEKIADIISKAPTVKDSFLPSPGAAFKVAGQIGGGVGDVIGGAYLGAGKAALPQSVENKVGGAAQAVMQSRPAQNIAGEWAQFKTKYPEAAAYLEAGTNILTGTALVQPGAISGAVKKMITPATKVPAQSLASGAKNLRTQAAQQVDESVARQIFSGTKKQPLLGGKTAGEVAVLADDTAKSGLFGRTKANLSDATAVKNVVKRVRQDIQTNTVLGTPGGKGKMLVSAKNLKNTIGALDKERQALVSQSKALISPVDVSNKLQKITIETMGKFPDVSKGAANRTQKFMLEKFLQLYNKVDDSGTRVYKGDVNGFANAVKDWKAAVRKEMPDVFKPKDSAGTLKAELFKAMREELDNIVDESLLRSGVIKNSGDYLQLGKQMYISQEVADGLTKALSQGVNQSMMRAFKNIGVADALLYLSGAAAVSLGVIFGPQVTSLVFALLAAGGAIKYGKHAITGPAMKEALAKGMEGIAKKIATETDDAAKQLLISDYAALSALLEKMVEAENEALKDERE